MVRRSAEEPTAPFGSLDESGSGRGVLVKKILSNVWSYVALAVVIAAVVVIVITTRSNPMSMRSSSTTPPGPSPDQGCSVPSISKRPPDAPVMTTCTERVSDDGATAGLFTATLQNASLNGTTNECLIFGGNGPEIQHVKLYRYQ